MTIPLVHEQIESLFSMAPFAVLLASEDGRIAMANSQAESMLQYAHDELVGLSVEVLIPACFDNMPVHCWLSHFTEPHEQPTGRGLEFNALRKGGHKLPVEVSLSSFKTDTETLLVVSMTDVTQRKHAEHLFHQLFQHSPDGTVVADKAGRITLVNTRAEEMFGFTSEELIGQPVEMLVPMRLQHRHKVDVGEYCDHPSVRPMGVNGHFSARCKDGSELPVEISLAPVETLRGLMVFASIRDVTEHRRLVRESVGTLELQRATAEILRLSLSPLPLDQLLGQSLKQLLAVPWLSQVAAGAIFLIDPDNPEILVLHAHQGLADEAAPRRRRVSAAQWLDVTDVPPAEILFTTDIHDHQLVMASSMPPRGHYNVPLVTDGYVLGVLHVNVPPDHRRRPEQEAFLTAMADLLAGLIRRKRAEVAQRDSEERFELAVRGTDAGIWDWDLRTNQVYFSPRWKGMLGYRPNEMADNFDEWETRLHPDDRERALASVHDYLEGHSDKFELEHRLRHKDGSYRWILARGAAVFDDQGHAYRMVGSHLDVTRRRKVEQRLRENRLQLLAAQRIQQRLLPQSPPQVLGLDIAGACFPAEYAAGDYFDFLTLPDGSTGLVVADVRGHGVGPALLMATASAHIRSFAALNMPVAQIVSQANRILCEQMEDDQFITLLLCRLDRTTGTLTHVNAGHPLGYVIDRSGAVKNRLGTGGLPLGILPDGEYPESSPVDLMVGDTVVLLTDGLLEATGTDGVFFGTQRLLDLICAHRDRPATELIQLLRRELIGLTGTETLEDDVTLVVAKVQQLPA